MLLAVRVSNNASCCSVPFKHNTLLIVWFILVFYKIYCILTYMIIGKLYIHRFRIPGNHGFDNNVEEMQVCTYVHL